MITNFSTVELEKSHKFLQIQLGSHIARLETELPDAYKSKAARQKLAVARQPSYHPTAWDKRHT